VTEYEVEVVGRSREVYRVTASSEQEARNLWPEDGVRILAEVDDVEVVNVACLNDEEPDRAPSAEQEQAWNEQYNGTSLGS